jgi:methylated-DNA-protein-cysteine methyltransferase-like protein
MKHVPGHLPWHRVVNAQGGISRRANVGSMLTQRVLLEQEGVPVRRGRIRLRDHRWAGPRGARRPLDIAALARL